MRWTPLAVLLCCLGLAGVAAAEQRAVEGIPKKVLMRLRNGHTSVVHKYLAEQRALGPLDDNHLALEAVAFAKQERSQQAIAGFSRSEGCQLYENIGMRFHADALRAVGEGRAAAELRTMQLELTELPPALAHIAKMERIRDLVSAGAYDEALEAADQAIAEKPQWAAYYAAKSEVYTAMGDYEEASWWLWMAEFRFVRPESVLYPQAALMTAIGDGGHAELLLRDNAKGRRHRPELWRHLVEAIAQTERWEYALQVLDRQLIASMPDPTLRALRARVLHGLGRTDEAREVALDALELAPGNVAVQEAAAVVLDTD
jgi:tetratricopeptide (TPR) repeat protein